MRGSADWLGYKHAGRLLFRVRLAGRGGLLAIGCATFVLPYLIPVAVGLALVYRRSSIIMPAAGFFFMAVFCSHSLWSGTATSRRISLFPRKALFWALIVVFVLCLPVAITVSRR